MSNIDNKIQEAKELAEQFEQTTDYKIGDVISWSSYGSGYYEIKTKAGIYCFPISRTVLKIIKN